MREDRAAVFVIDDDASVRRSLDSLLRSVGLDVHLYASAPEFMRAEPSASARVKPAFPREEKAPRSALSAQGKQVKKPGNTLSSDRGALPRPPHYPRTVSSIG